MMEHVDAPSTIKEVGIHVGYMRDDIRELKDIVKALPTSFVSIKEHQELVGRVTLLERRNGLKNTLQWVGLAVTTIISVLALYNLFNGE